jgi:photosystem II stability/assembly factor-like uncharacterized protein
MTTLHLATRTGVVTCLNENGVWQVKARSLNEQYVTTVIAQDGVLLAGTKTGIQFSDTEGKHWETVNEGLTIQHIRWLAHHPDSSNLVFAGTEPAGIFALRNGAHNWEEIPEVPALRDKHTWMLPYSPEAGCVRGFAFHGQRSYAAVEVGGVLRSDDRGQSWELAPGSDGSPALSGPPEPFIYPDVHDIAVHPSNPDLVVAATGGGLYRSNDGGAAWDLIYDCYCRGLWLDPGDPDHMIFGPADYVGSVGRIEETHDGGRTWHNASHGLEVPWPRTMPERISQIGQSLFGVLDDGRLLTAPLATLEWKAILQEAGKVNAVAGVGE